jgi:hypothetical protein
MSYLVFCTFDLKNASSTDYNNAYDDLATIGLSRIQTASDGGRTVIPTTSAMGTFESQSASAAAEYVRDQVKAAFAKRKLRSEIFITAGGQWAWVASST